MVNSEPSVTPFLWSCINGTDGERSDREIVNPRVCLPPRPTSLVPVRGVSVKSAVAPTGQFGGGNNGERDPIAVNHAEVPRPFILGRAVGHRQNRVSFSPALNSNATSRTKQVWNTNPLTLHVFPKFSVRRTALSSTMRCPRWLRSAATARQPTAPSTILLKKLESGLYEGMFLS